MRISPLRIRAFRIRNCGLTGPLPQPAANVIFLVSPETRAYLTSVGETRPDVWSCYSVQQFRLLQRHSRLCNRTGSVNDNKRPRPFLTMRISPGTPLYAAWLPKRKKEEPDGTYLVHMDPVEFQAVMASAGNFYYAG